MLWSDCSQFIARNLEHAVLELQIMERVQQSWLSGWGGGLAPRSTPTGTPVSLVAEEGHSAKFAPRLQWVTDIKLRKKPCPDPDDCCSYSYRRISNLSLISKLIERVVITAHVSDHSLFPVQQPAYHIARKTHKTIMFHEFAPNLVNVHFPMQDQSFGTIYLWTSVLNQTLGVSRTFLRYTF